MTDERRTELTFTEVVRTVGKLVAVLLVAALLAAAAWQFHDWTQN